MRRHFIITASGRTFIKQSVLYAALLAMLLCACPAMAGVIKISGSVTAELSAQGALVKVGVANHGSDSAHGLRVIVEVAGQRYEKAGPDVLKPDATCSLRFNPTNIRLAPGVHPVLVRIIFHNHEGHAFNNIAVSTISKGKPGPGRLRLLAKGQTIVGLGTVNFTLVNPQPRSLKANLRVFAPNEFKASLAQSKFKAVSGKQPIEVEVRNLSAFAGASYPLYLIAQYDLAGVHHTTTGVAQVVVQAPGDPLAPWRIHLIIASAVLLVLIVLFEVLRRRRRP